MMKNRYLVILMLLFGKIIHSMQPELYHDTATPVDVKVVLENNQGENNIYSSPTRMLNAISDSIQIPETIYHLINLEADPGYIDAFGRNSFDKYKNNDFKNYRVLFILFSKLDQYDPVNILKYGSINEIESYLNQQDSLNYKIRNHYVIEWITFFNSSYVLDEIMLNFTFDRSHTPTLLSNLKSNIYEKSEEKIDILKHYWKLDEN